MNRSFRAPERGMPGGGAATEAKHRQQNGDSLRSSLIREKEEELGLFLEMRKHEKERDNLLFQNTEEFDAPLGPRMGSSPIFSIPSATPARKTGADDFLNSDNDKNDYDWLLTPPGTPLFPSLEMESQRTVMIQLGNPKARPTALRSRLADSQPKPTARVNSISRQPAIPPGSNSSNAGLRRPSSSGGPGSRPATPTGRPTLTTSKPTSITTSGSVPAASSRSVPATSSSRPASSMSSRPTSTIASNPTPTTSSRPSRSSTPTPRPALASNKPTLPARSSTPTPRSTARPSTPTRQSSLPATKPVSRTATPTRRPNALSTTTKSAMSAPGPAPSPPVKSPSLTKSVPSTARNQVPPRASSPTVKPKTLKPSEMPGFSYDVPPNLRTSLSDRSISATRGRPGAPSIRSSSVNPAPNGRGLRRQSCSPSRGRPPNGVNQSMGGSVPALNRAYAKANDHVTPGQYGTNMVERVINMRKLVPPKQEDKHSPRSNLSGKSSSPESMGIGRTLSKKSLDMAIRHMDLRRTIPGNLRPMLTNIPASSMYSVRSPGPTRGRTISVSDSPLATSSNASSEVSVNNNALCLDGNVDDEINSEKGVRSSASLLGRRHAYRDQADKSLDHINPPSTNGECSFLTSVTILGPLENRQSSS